MRASAPGSPVEVVPGPTALAVALVLSGLPADRFVFEGFLPRKGADRRARLAALAAEPRTAVLYESPRRVAATLADLVAACGARPAGRGRSGSSRSSTRRCTAGRLARRPRWRRDRRAAR